MLRKMMIRKKVNAGLSQPQGSIFIIKTVRRPKQPTMDDDDDFFDMRARIRIPEKRRRAKYDEEGSHSGSSSSCTSFANIANPTASEESEPEIVLPKRPYWTYDCQSNCSVIKKAVPPSKKKKKPIISLSSDDEDSFYESPEKEVERKRQVSLTPPPTLSEEALQQAMNVIKEHVHRPNTRQHLNAATSGSLVLQQHESSDIDDDFDIAAYRSTMTSNITQQAAFKSEIPVTKAEETKLTVILRGRRKGDDSLPEDWEVPVGFHVLSSMTFMKLRKEFQNKKRYTKDIVMAFKDLRLFHGSPRDMKMKTNDEIRTCRFQLY
jgi:hypothetical protein